MLESRFSDFKLDSHSSSVCKCLLVSKCSFTYDNLMFKLVFILGLFSMKLAFFLHLKLYYWNTLHSKQLTNRVMLDLSISHVEYADNARNLLYYKLLYMSYVKKSILYGPVTTVTRWEKGRLDFKAEFITLVQLPFKLS